MPVPVRWHPGEIAAQQARGYEEHVTDGWAHYYKGAPSYMVPFLEALPFLSVTTLDEQGRPWGSVLCNDGRVGFIKLIGDEESGLFECTIQAPVGVPIRDCLLRLDRDLKAGIEPYDANGDVRSQFQFGGVGVMLHNRRRNKLEGVITQVDRIASSDKDSRFVFHMQITSTFGNCPKYINCRVLLPSQASDLAPVCTQGTGKRLPEEVLSIIAAADTTFLATTHSGDANAYPADPNQLGNNIRGGPSGFLRSFWDEEAQSTCIVLPDWSGNRLMMSFGNITSDHVAGLVIPIWSNKSSNTGDVLHLTCDAEVLANDEASNLIRGVRGAVKLWPTSWSLVRGGIPLYAADASNTPQLQQIGFPSIAWSPYNPPVRLLSTEKSSLATDSRPTATLIDALFYTPSLATFTFQIDGGTLPYTPGQHIIMDCYNLLDTRFQMYTHMAHFKGGEKDLNDDGTRSWTVSYGIKSKDGSNLGQYQLTLRRKDRGGVTPGLFQRGIQMRRAIDEGDTEYLKSKMQVPILGIDGDCILPSPPSNETQLRLAYIVSGIGLTPMLPHLSQLAQDGSRSASILAVMAVKWDEVRATQRMIESALKQGKAATPGIHIVAYILAGRIPDDATESEFSDIDNDSQAVANVTVEWHITRGQRLQIDSFTASADTGGFRLPASASASLQASHQVVICAGDAFAKTAREACKQVNISDEVIKLESFSF